MHENRHRRRMLQRGRVESRSLRMPALRQLFFVFLAFVALAIQSLVVQTHIHREAGGFAPSIALAAAAGDTGSISTPADSKSNPLRDPFEAGGSSSTCTLCQAFAHSGLFVQNAAVLAYVPAWISIHFIVVSDLPPSLLAVSHSWQGRAPPQH